jgi:hypothetical protein
VRWRICKDYPKYEVSETGIVRHIERQKILTPREDYKGYLRVDLSYNKNKLIHKLVFFTFNDLAERIGYEIDHIDGNKKNNHVSNLQYITRRENQVKGLKHTWLIIVREISTGKFIMYTSGRELAQSLQIDPRRTLREILFNYKFKKKFILIHKELIKC